MMLKFLFGLSLVSLISSSSMFAQTFEGICSTGTWVQQDVSITQVWDPNSNTYFPVGETKYFYFTVTSDTIVNTLTYHKLQSTMVNYDLTTGLISPIGLPHLALIFRNGINKETYKMYPNQSTETLWADFNYIVGESQTFSNIFNTTDLYLNEIIDTTWCDTVLNHHNYTWSSAGGLTMLEMVEGLGSPQNFIHIYGTDAEYDKVLFFCPTITPIENVHLEILSAVHVPVVTQNNLIVAPNPHSNSFRIDHLTYDVNAWARLFDLQGRQVMDGIDPYNEIITTDLLPGRYILKIYSNNQVSNISVLKR
jgi:hypothetical protein